MFLVKELEQFWSECSFFHWAFGIVSSTSCFCQQKGQETHKFIGFRIYFCRFCIWFSPCWGEDLPPLCLAWSHFLQMRWSMRSLLEVNPWSKISCKAKAKAFFICYHHFLEVGDLCLGLFLLIKKEFKMDLSNDTSVSRMKRKSAIIEREFEKGEWYGSYCSRYTGKASSIGCLWGW